MNPTPPSLREICANATKARRFLKFSRWSKDAPINGYAIEVEGKVPYLASAGVAEPNHTLIVGEEFRRQITTGYTESEVEANAMLIARFSPATALAVYEAMEGVLRVADRKTDEFDAVRRAINLLDGRTEP